MRKIFRLKFFASILLSVLVIMMISSCQKDEDKDEPPDLPPITSLLMDFTDFDNPNDTLTKRKAIETYQNWGHAFVTVSFWNILSTWTIALPVLAYAEAFDQSPLYLGENSWQWAYDVAAGQDVYSIKLISKRISNEEFTMKMLVTKSGVQGYEDFKWFEGTVRYDRTSASWTLYENPGAPNEVVSIDWEMDWEADTYTIKYTYIRPGAAENGSYIEHGVTGDSPYDAYYTVSTLSNTVEIEWDKATKAGRVKDPLKFGNSDWHCWGENLADAVCQ